MYMIFFAKKFRYSTEYPCINSRPAPALDNHRWICKKKGGVHTDGTTYQRFYENFGKEYIWWTNSNLSS